MLTNLSLEEAIAAYKTRSGIEAMFRDCKSGGYNLEGSKASDERLTRLVLLIAEVFRFIKIVMVKIYDKKKQYACSIRIRDSSTKF